MYVVHLKQEYIYKQIYFILLFLVYRYDIMRIKIEGQEDMIMALRYKVDVIQLLKDSGYSTYAIRKEKLIIENMLQKLRNKEMVSWTTLDTICRLTHSQPGDILEYVPDEDKK